jgi:anti-sigma factor RsiW
MFDDKQSSLSESSIEMIHLVIDGEASPQQQAEVQQLLAGSPEAVHFYESMRDLARELDAIPAAAAPGLKNQILADLREQGRDALRAPAIPIRTYAQRRRRLVVGLAWAAAAVLLVVVAVDRLVVSGDRVVPTQAAASMPSRDVEAWPLLNRIASGDGTLTIRRSGDRFALQFLPEPPDTLTISWDDEKLDFLSESEDGTLILQRRNGVAGSAAVSVLLEDKPIVETSIDLD